MNNILKIGLICILFIMGGVFLIISPFSKKEQVAETIKIEAPIVQPVQPLMSSPLSTENLKKDITVIKSYTDLITDILQKIFGTITSGLGVYLTIKQLKDKKKKA